VLLLACAAFINGHSSPHVKPGLQCVIIYHSKNLQSSMCWGLFNPKRSHRSVGWCTQRSLKILHFHKVGHFSCQIIAKYLHLYQSSPTRQKVFFFPYISNRYCMSYFKQTKCFKAISNNHQTMLCKYTMNH